MLTHICKKVLVVEHIRCFPQEKHSLLQYCRNRVKPRTLEHETPYFVSWYHSGSKGRYEEKGKWPLTAKCYSTKKKIFLAKTPFRRDFFHSISLTRPRCEKRLAKKALSHTHKHIFIHTRSYWRSWILSTPKVNNPQWPAINFAQRQKSAFSSSKKKQRKDF